MGKKSRQPEEKRWEDNIREWTGLQFSKWRKLVVKSSVVPKRGEDEGEDILSVFLNNSSRHFEPLGCVGREYSPMMTVTTTY